MDKMTFTDGVILMLQELAPSFILICVVFIILSWLRLLLDVMSGRGL